MKKRLISLVLFVAMLFSCGLMNITVHAESLGLPSSSYTAYVSNEANSYALIEKVFNCSSGITNSDVSSKIYKVLFDASHKPRVLGGSQWYSGYIRSASDSGLNVTITFPGSYEGCFSYASFISKYVRNSYGSWTGIPQSRPSSGEIKAFVEQYADPGEHVQFRYTANGGIHSVIFLFSDADGFYFLSTFSGADVKLFYCTYDKLKSILRYDSGTPLMIYDTNSGRDVSGSIPQNPVSSEDPSNYKVSFSRVLYVRDSWSINQRMHGNDVKYIQICLKYLGYNVDTDGWYGPATASVVKKFQSDNGVSPVDGDCGSVTWNAIENAVSKKKNNSSDPAPQNPVSSEDPSNYKVSFSRVLYVRDSWSINQRMHGNDVKYIQICLKYLGYNVDTDGWYGPATASVVKKFQSDNGVSPVDGDCGSVTWNAIENAVSKKKNNSSTQTNKTITITQQPSNQNAKAGATVKLSVKASGTGLKYQWYYKKSGAKSWTKWSNKTKATVSFKMAKGWNKAQFYCLIKNSSGKSVKTQSVKVTLIEELKISTQPKNKSVKTGKSASFSIKASGSNLSYQWYYKKKGAKSWTKWSGKTNASVSLKATKSWNGAQFYCQVKDGYNQSVKSKSAKLTVKK